MLKKKQYNKSSVYCEIEKLLSKDVIIEIDLLDGKKRYELNNHIHHHHALWTKCGAVICIDIPNNLDQVEKKLFEQKGFRFTGHALDFWGYLRNVLYRYLF